MVSFTPYCKSLNIRNTSLPAESLPADKAETKSGIN